MAGRLNPIMKDMLQAMEDLDRCRDALTAPNAFFQRDNLRRIVEWVKANSVSIDIDVAGNELVSRSGNKIALKLHGDEVPKATSAESKLRNQLIAVR